MPTNAIIGGSLGTGLGYLLTKSLPASLGFGIIGAGIGHELGRASPQENSIISPTKETRNIINQWIPHGGNELEPPEEPLLNKIMNHVDPNYNFGKGIASINLVENSIPDFYTWFLPESTKGIANPLNYIKEDTQGNFIERGFNLFNPIKGISNLFNPIKGISNLTKLIKMYKEIPNKEI